MVGYSFPPSFLVQITRVICVTGNCQRHFIPGMHETWQIHDGIQKYQQMNRHYSHG